jgi:hypothetical protein
MELELCLDRILKNMQIYNFIKICPVGSKLFHTGQMDMTELMVTFHNFV